MKRVSCILILVSCLATSPAFPQNAPAEATIGVFNQGDRDVLLWIDGRISGRLDAGAWTGIQAPAGEVHLLATDLQTSAIVARESFSLSAAETARWTVGADGVDEGIEVTNLDAELDLDADLDDPSLIDMQAEPAPAPGGTATTRLIVTNGLQHPVEVDLADRPLAELAAGERRTIPRLVSGEVAAVVRNAENGEVVRELMFTLIAGETMYWRIR